MLLLCEYMVDVGQLLLIMCCANRVGVITDLNIPCLKTKKLRLVCDSVILHELDHYMEQILSKCCVDRRHVPWSKGRLAALWGRKKYQTSRSKHTSLLIVTLVLHQLCSDGHHVQSWLQADLSSQWAVSNWSPSAFPQYTHHATDRQCSPCDCTGSHCYFRKALGLQSAFYRSDLVR